MSHTVKLSADTADKLMRDILVQDYQSFLADIEQLGNLQDPQPYQLGDLEDDRRYAAAMEVMLEYYLDRNTYLKVVPPKAG